MLTSTLAAALAATALGGGPTECGTYSGSGCAPASARVDLARPSVPASTSITNPLFPISRLRSAVLLGQVDGEDLRVETTLLPGSRRIGGVRALASQYMAYLDGQIEEVAVDWYAQAADGAVWYLGEDVFNYSDGAVADTEGTWLAGRDGPAAMIMPAHPRVGDVFRPENVPGIVFEEVTVKAVDRTVAGPRGPVRGAIVTEELHLDGGKEDKVFAPGYGEFSTGSGRDLEAIALAVPTDALPGPVPQALRSLSTGAIAIVGSAGSRDWEGAAATLRRLARAWDEVRRGQVPPMVAERAARALAALGRAVGGRRSAAAARAALDLRESALDLELRHRPPAEVDADRFDVRAQRLLLAARARDARAVMGDVAALEWLRDRFAHRLGRARAGRLDAGLRALRAAADARNLEAAGDHAARVAALVRAGYRGSQAYSTT